jgi:hypothetical protein
VESAVAARDALLQNEIGAQGFTGARVGFAKIPPLATPPTTGGPGSLSRNNSDAAAVAVEQQELNSSSSPSLANGAAANNNNNENLLIDATNAWQNDLFHIMVQFNTSEEIAHSYVKGKRKNAYFLHRINT